MKKKKRLKKKYNWEQHFSQVTILPLVFRSGSSLRCALALSKRVRNAVLQDPELVARVQFFRRFTGPRTDPAADSDTAAALLLGRWLESLLAVGSRVSVPLLPDATQPSFPEPPALDRIRWTEVLEMAERQAREIDVSLCATSTLVGPTPRTTLTATISCPASVDSAAVHLVDDLANWSAKVFGANGVMLCFSAAFERCADPDNVALLRSEWNRVVSGDISPTLYTYFVLDYFSPTRTCLNPFNGRPQTLCPSKTLIRTDDQSSINTSLGENYPGPLVSEASSSDSVQNVIRTLTPGAHVKVRCHMFACLPGERLEIGRRTHGIQSKIKIPKLSPISLWTNDYVFHADATTARPMTRSVDWNDSLFTCNQCSSQLKRPSPVSMNTTSTSTSTSTTTTTISEISSIGTEYSSNVEPVIVPGGEPVATAFVPVFAIVHHAFWETDQTDDTTAIRRHYLSNRFAISNVLNLCLRVEPDQVTVVKVKHKM